MINFLNNQIGKKIYVYRDDNIINSGTLIKIDSFAFMISNGPTGYKNTFIYFISGGYTIKLQEE